MLSFVGFLFVFFVFGCYDVCPANLVRVAQSIVLLFFVVVFVFCFLVVVFCCCCCCLSFHLAVSVDDHHFLPSPLPTAYTV